MKILALQKNMPGVTYEQFGPYFKAETVELWKHYLAGTVRELYLRPDEHTVVFVMECQDTAEAADILNALPLVREGLIAFDLIPLAPYPGFAHLFEQP